MPTYNIRSGDLRGIQRELEGLLKQHNKRRAQRVKQAVKRTAQLTAKYVKSTTVPIAFHELVDSIQANPSSVTADAPHAAAVEEGSRPHWVPLDALIKWVKLRGMQGLRSNSRLKRLRGSSTYRQARSVAAVLRTYERGGASPVNAPEAVAKAIQLAIAKKGTRPHRFMQKAVPFAEETLFREVSEAVPDTE